MNVRLRKMRTGTSGAAARRSTATKATAAPAPPASRSAPRPPPPGSASALNPSVASAEAPTARSPPAQSSGPAAGDRLSGTWARARSTTTAASGRLSQNAARQPSVSIRKPPTAGPSAVVIAAAPAQVPIARPRISCGKAAEMIARLCGTISAAPTPWIARAATSQAVPGASAHAIDAPAKTSVPATNTRRRPNRSPAEPPTSRRAARNSV